MPVKKGTKQSPELIELLKAARKAAMERKIALGLPGKKKNSKPLSAEARANIGAGVKAHMSVHGSNRKGIAMTDEQKLKLSIAGTGQKRPRGPESEEKKVRIAESVRRTKASLTFIDANTVTCPHCGHSAVTSGLMFKYHFDNCKKRIE